MTLAGVGLVTLAAAVFTIGSLDIPVHPDQGSAFVIFFSLTTFIGAAFLVFGFILIRTLVRLWAEHRAGQMGSRFKAKMVLGALGISLLPVGFLFFFSYAIVNRTLVTWFPRPLEIANDNSRALMDEMSSRGHARMLEQARASCEMFSGASHKTLGEALRSAAPGADAIWFAESGKTKGMATAEPSSADARDHPVLERTLSTGAEVWAGDKTTFVGASAPCGAGSIVVGRVTPGDYLDRYNAIETQTNAYLEQKQSLRAYKREILLVLVLITLLPAFAAAWVALFLTKQVTVPIQALAEATREISRGNFDHHVEVQAQDELGMLVRSFNRMTDQLGEGRRQINEFTQSLEQAIEEREGRRKLMEAILENIPTGVVSLSETGEVSRVNSAMAAILGEEAHRARTLAELLGEDASRSVLHLMRRSLRMGVASREIEIATGGRLVRTAVKVTALGPRRSNPGFVVVIDDLTELLRAQKAAAWQEVAQRIAHEIKNPLTPIQLSAQRMLRYLDRSSRTAPGAPGARTEFEQLAAECATLIEREVQTLESLVDEFSQFARFPSAKLAPEDLNAIVTGALKLFHGRLDGIVVRTDLAASLPTVRADRELLGRVIVNLIDNAAEAMEGSGIRQLRVATRAESDRDAVEIEVSDSGHGISPQDKQRLFLPHFSTKDRGTGLGLAIASRIIAEHNGTIRVEDNLPTGAKFLIRFPAIDVVNVETR
ncbi:MAG: ATP-binding protein [Candidatus Acidiferrales bacterium]